MITVTGILLQADTTPRSEAIIEFIAKYNLADAFIGSVARTKTDKDGFYRMDVQSGLYDVYCQINPRSDVELLGEALISNEISGEASLRDVLYFTTPISNPELVELRQSLAEIRILRTEVNEDHADIQVRHDDIITRHDDIAFRNSEVERLQSDVEVMHGEVSIMHPDVVTKHGDIVARHGDIVTKHGDVVTKHGDMVSRHADIVTRHGDIEVRHADIIVRHDDVVAKHSSTVTLEQQAKDSADRSEAHAELARNNAILITQGS